MRESQRNLPWEEWTRPPKLGFDGRLAALLGSSLHFKRRRRTDAG